MPDKVIVIDPKGDYLELIKELGGKQLIIGSEAEIDISLTDAEVAKIIGKD